MFHVADCCWFGGRFIYWFQHQAVLEGPGFSHFCTFSERLVKMEESNLRVEIVRRVDFGQDRQRNTISGKAAVALHSCYSIFWFMRSTFLIGGGWTSHLLGHVSFCYHILLGLWRFLTIASLCEGTDCMSQLFAVPLWTETRCHLE